MIYMLDSATAPSASVLATAKLAGYSALGVYIYGPNAVHVWTDEEIQRAIDAGFEKFVPICVPNMTGGLYPVKYAASCVQALSDTPLQGALCLDVEHSAGNTEDTTNFWTSWAAEVKAQGITPILYNGPHLMVTGSTWAPIWGSAPSLVPKTGGVQYASVYLGGHVFDRSQMGDSFPFATPRAMPAKPKDPSPTTGGSVTFPTIDTAVASSTFQLPVACAQTLLNYRLQYSMLVDGMTGPVTHSETTYYQAHNGLIVDGIIGPQTWASLVGGS